MFDWKKSFEQPLMILAPMEDVTDTVFRRVVAECGRPDVMFTEFTSVEGVTNQIGRNHVIHRFEYTDAERPIIAQIWGKTPQNYRDTAQLCVQRGFDGIDINMGCPDRTVIKNGCCSALIKNPLLAAEIIAATKEGVAGKIPVSVKTRIGFDTITTTTWIPFLLQQGIAALTIHGRTVKDLSKVPNRWQEIATAVQLRDQLQPDTADRTPIIGNGDIISLAQAHNKIAEMGLQGIMIGRGIFKNPWIFNPDITEDMDGNLIYMPSQVVYGKQHRLQVLLRHLELWQQCWGEQKNQAIMKKFYKMYVQSFAGASALRQQLMEAESLQQAMEIVYNQQVNNE